MTTADQELLELAAKAAGIDVQPVEVKNVEFQGDDRFIGYRADPDQWQRGWFDPLTDDSDALRLAVKLEINVIPSMEESSARNPSYTGWINERNPADAYAATRRAITRTAAEIGRGMA